MAFSRKNHCRCVKNGLTLKQSTLQQEEQKRFEIGSNAEIFFFVLDISERRNYAQGPEFMGRGEVTRG